MEKITGRKEEIQLLEEALQSKGASLVAVYGRRRVSKTFLVRTFFHDRFYSIYFSSNTAHHILEEMITFKNT
jgi:AAA+ ATPase superfamily predicted ATPase